MQSRIRIELATLGAGGPEVINEKRDFYGRFVLASEPEKCMLERTLTFGRYRLEPLGGLMSGGRNVHLTPKALALLAFLADRHGEVVTKDQLFGAVWPEVSVGDAALVTCIQELRRALKDDARRPRYIETLHRRGYRFVGRMTTRLPAAIGGKAHALPLPDRPSIAVLPFANMSDDPDQAYFA